MLYFGRHFLNKNQIKLNNSKENIEIPKYLINPDGKFKKAWDIIMILGLVYLSTYGPYRVAFDETT
jgi:hypothetical protein